jgi:hypothetical protein
VPDRVRSSAALASATPQPPSGWSKGFATLFVDEAVQDHGYEPEKTPFPRPRGDKRTIVLSRRIFVLQELLDAPQAVIDRP